MVEVSRQSVKIIMAKNEILQNDSIQQEVNTVEKYLNKAQGYNHKLI